MTVRALCACFGCLLLLTLPACNAGRINDKDESWAEQLELAGVSPPLLTYGTTLEIFGRGFVGTELGTSRLVMRLRDRSFTDGATVEVSTLLTRESRTRMTSELTTNTFEQICPFSAVDLVGEAFIETVSAETAALYRSKSLQVSLACQRRLSPNLEGVPFRAMYLNEAIIMSASGMLLGNSEGQSYAVVSGCVLSEGVVGNCSSNAPTYDEKLIPIEPTDTLGRRNPSLVIGPDLVGLTPGFFEGTVYLRNETIRGEVLESQPLSFNVQVLDSSLDRVDVNGSSLGGYIDFFGNGFVGRDAAALTSIIVQGTFEDQDGMITEIQSEVVTSYAGPDLVRYVLSEEDALGQILKLRRRSGVVVATFRPVLSFGTAERELPPLSSAFEILPVRQVVYAHYLPGFEDALERFGLSQAAELIKDLIIQRATLIFAGIGLEIRDVEPEDFALYAQVELTGFDPNGIGLMGYDNTPGKDVGNERLYDRIGGVHALTQEDGYPGYGGIFVESFFGFSRRPPSGIQPHPGASDAFDRIFDAVRAGSGRSASQAEIELFVPVVANQICLSPNRSRQNEVNCAIVVLSNLIGSTMAHEIAHSLGLADPEGTLFHNPQSAPNHLMDAGGERPFEERAVLADAFGEYFCSENYEYLRQILPTSLPDPLPNRTPCY